MAEPTPKPKADAITPADAPTDYPPVGVAVSTGTAWDASIPAAEVALLNSTALFTGPWVQVNNTFYSGGISNFGSVGNWACTIHPDGSIYAPAISVASSPVVTVAMLDPAVVNERLAALEAAVGVAPPGQDPRSETRSALTAEAQANQDLNDEIFAAQRAEAERVENIQNPPTFQ